MPKITVMNRSPSEVFIPAPLNLRVFSHKSVTLGISDVQLVQFKMSADINKLWAKQIVAYEIDGIPYPTPQPQVVPPAVLPNSGSAPTIQPAQPTAEAVSPPEEVIPLDVVVQPSPPITPAPTDKPPEVSKRAARRAKEKQAATPNPPTETAAEVVVTTVVSSDTDTGVEAPIVKSDE